MALIPGTPSSLSGSMAEAIQDAFNSYYPQIMGKSAPDANKQMTLLCLAIAEGVIKHLKAHSEAFEIKTSLDNGNTYNAKVRIV
ncbi:chloramphenicol 3-O-phosphotransferase [Pedobacter sp. UYEF25]